MSGAAVPAGRGGIVKILEDGNANRDGEGQGARFFRVDRRAKLMDGYVLAPRDFIQQAPCEAVQAEARAPLADTDVVIDKAVAGF